MSIRTLIAFAILTVVPLSAQLASPNSAGVAIGHIHINATDVEAQKAFWVQLGGIPVNNEKLMMVQFPGIYIVLRKQDPTGGTVGSAINHFGFYVKNSAQAQAKWKAAGLKWEPGNTPGQGFLTGPDNVRVEIYENTSLSGPIAMHHVHLNMTDPMAAQKWYVENFGATAGKRGMFETANVPGTEITLGKNETPQTPTKGRSVDHMGFEVKNIDDFVKKLAAKGIQIEGGIRTSANASKLRIAFLTDPWGTYIELTEGLTPASVQSSN
jgi:catechol 2,3-dioxygenase-like lactoylglutathione lyase family enzyme